MKNSTKYLKSIAIISVILFGCTNKQLNTFTKEEIKQFEKLSDLSEMQYIRLAASISTLDTIFNERDTSFRIFKDLIELGISKPVIMRDVKTDMTQFDSEEIINQLRKYKMSTQDSYRINNSIAAYADTTKSTVGSEVRKLLKEIGKANR